MCPKMDELEKEVLKANHLAIIADLDVKDIAPVLYQTSMIDIEQYEGICKSGLTRRKLCGSFLIDICKSKSKCTFGGLLDALRHNNSYGFLADKLSVSLHNIQQTNDDKNIADVESGQDTQEDNREMLFEPIRKVNVFNSSRKKIARLAFELKRLSHDGQTDKLSKLTTLIHKKFNEQKLILTLPVEQKMELADMRFTALESEASAKRVKYDVSLCGSDVFKEMTAVIPFTTNPRVSSMTYLARFGSSVGMSDGIDPGLAYLQYAKEHAEYVSPCKDTGMVYYIEVNLLAQKYESSPSDELKLRVLQTTQHAMSQFESENDEIRNDYQRMLMLKMVFCYLGIGLFGKKIPNIETTQYDIEAAKNCLDFIEKPEVWNGMEKRRKMLFLLAKTEYYRIIGSHDLAKIHAKESRKLARQNGWKAELPNIENMVRELEEQRNNAHRFENNDEFMQKLIEDLSGDQESVNKDDNDMMNTMGAVCTKVRLEILKESAMDNDISATDDKESKPSQTSQFHSLCSPDKQGGDLPHLKENDIYFENCSVPTCSLNRHNAMPYIGHSIRTPCQMEQLKGLYQSRESLIQGDITRPDTETMTEITTHETKLALCGNRNSVGERGFPQNSLCSCTQITLGSQNNQSFKQNMKRDFPCELPYGVQEKSDIVVVKEPPARKRARFDEDINVCHSEYQNIRCRYCVAPRTCQDLGQSTNCRHCDTAADATKSNGDTFGSAESLPCLHDYNKDILPVTSSELPTDKVKDNLT